MNESAAVELRLLNQIAQGDQEAFARLYDLLAGKVLALIQQILVDSAQSEEVLQEVFLEIWQKAARFSPSAGSVRGWVSTIARRRAIDRVRSTQAARERDQAYFAATSENAILLPDLEKNLVAAQVRQVLAKIGEPHATTIKLAFFTGMTHSQIAAAQQVPLGTVKTRIRDGLTRMRKFLEETR